MAVKVYIPLMPPVVLIVHIAFPEPSITAIQEKPAPLTVTEPVGMGAAPLAETTDRVKVTLLPIRLPSPAKVVNVVIDAGSGVAIGADVITGVAVGIKAGMPAMPTSSAESVAVPAPFSTQHSTP